MRLNAACLVLGGLMILCVGTAQADPIVYLGTLSPGVPVTGTNQQNPGNFSNPIGADYWQFNATIGNLVNIFADRLVGSYDDAFWVFRGVYTNTTDFGPSFPGAQAGNLIAFGDDQDPPNVPGVFGDGNVAFVAPTTGPYTIAVVNVFSSAGPPNPYRLQANGIATPVAPVPEPGCLVLLGGGLAAFAAIRYRRSKQGK